MPGRKGVLGVWVRGEGGVWDAPGGFVGKVRGCVGERARQCDGPASRLVVCVGSVSECSSSSEDGWMDGDKREREMCNQRRGTQTGGDDARGGCFLAFLAFPSLCRLPSSLPPPLLQCLHPPPSPLLFLGHPRFSQPKTSRASPERTRVHCAPNTGPPQAPFFDPFPSARHRQSGPKRISFTQCASARAAPFRDRPIQPQKKGFCRFCARGGENEHVAQNPGRRRSSVRL